MTSPAVATVVAGLAAPHPPHFFTWTDIWSPGVSGNPLICLAKVPLLVLPSFPPPPLSTVSAQRPGRRLQEAASSTSMQTYFFNLSNCSKVSIVLKHNGGWGGVMGEGLFILNVALTWESSAASCFKHSCSPSEQGAGAVLVDGAG